MAKNKSNRYLEFKMLDADHIAFSRYGINNTKKGKSAILWQRIMSVLIPAGVAALFWIYPISMTIRYVVTGIAVVAAVLGVVKARTFVLRANEKAILGSQNQLSRLDPPLNTIEFTEEALICNTTGATENVIKYSDIKTLEINEDGIFVGVSAEAIMYIPTHAFYSVEVMEETYEWMSEKVMA